MNISERKGYPDSEGLWWFKGQRGRMLSDGQVITTSFEGWWRPLFVFTGQPDFPEFTPGLLYVVGITIFGPVQEPLHPYNFAGAWIKMEVPE